MTEIPTKPLLSNGIGTVINVGIDILAEALRKQGRSVAEVQWQPPAWGDGEALDALNRARAVGPMIEEANRHVLAILVESDPVLVDLLPALEAIHGMNRRLVLHTGPAIDFQDMLPVQQTSVLGAIVAEGLAATMEAAQRLVERGGVEIAPGMDYDLPGGGAFATTASTPVFVAEDRAHRTRGFAGIQEGPAPEALRWGAYNQSVKERLEWFKAELGPLVSRALREMGGMPLREIVARSIHMGDDNHSRQSAASLMFLKQLTPAMIRLEVPTSSLLRCLGFLGGAERFFLHVLMSASAATLRATSGVDYSTVATGIGGNGVRIGIKVSSLGDQWFTAPAPAIHGRYLNPSWSENDAVPFCGDSSVVEMIGVGGLAAAAAPAVAIMSGRTVQDGIEATREMYEITVGRNPNYTIPALNFEGTPTGIDILKILETSIEPLSHVGILHRKGGQAGVGAAKIPRECAKRAVLAFVDKYGL